MKSERRIVAILGAGPAGTSTALSLMQSLNADNNCQVHLFNAQASNYARVGETIPPAATPVLKRLGIFDIVTQGTNHMVCPGSISLWNSEQPGHNDFYLDLVGQGYHLDRNKFDSQLLSKASNAGVTIHQGQCLSRVREEQGERYLSFSSKIKQELSFKADLVVDATGKSAAFARRLNICRNVFDDVIFLCCFLDIPPTSKVLPHTFVESVAEGWWYAAHLPGNKMIVTFCTDIESIKTKHWDQPERWISLLRQTKWLRQNIPNSLLEVSDLSLEIIKRSAPSSLLSSVCGDGWLAVGDAASSYDPITSAGITKALIHGEQAGAALASLINSNNSHSLHTYQQLVLDDFKQYVKVRSMLYGSEKRFPDSEFWRRRMGRTETQSDVNMGSISHSQALSGSA